MKTVPLLDVATLVADRVRPWEGEKGYVATGDAGDAGDVRPTPITYSDRPSRADLVAFPGDVCMARMASTRKVFIVSPATSQHVYSTGFAVLRPDPRHLDAGYLRHWLETRGLQSAKDRLCSGATQRAITNAGFEHLSIPICPLHQQRRVAAILDHADCVRTKRRQVLTRLDALTQAIFSAMFDARADPIHRLDTLIDPDDRINYGVVQPGDDTPGGVPLIRVADLRRDGVDRSALKRVATDIESAYSRSRINGNEILVSCVGSIGSVSVVRLADVGSNIARAITRVPIADAILRTFVAEFLRSERPQRYFVSELRTVAQPTLNVSQIAATQVPLPPRALQLEFASRVKHVTMQRASSARAFSASEELFASLQSRAFRGEV